MLVFILRYGIEKLLLTLFILIIPIYLKNINRQKTMYDMTMQNQASDVGPRSAGKNNCKVEAVVSVDERGQMVLPKELRDRAHIRAGDKLAVVGCEQEGAICCISLIKVEELSATVKGVLGPIFKDIL